MRLFSDQWSALLFHYTLMERSVIFLSSWDDGHPLDLRIAELLDRHGLSGTFFVPKNNIECRPVMSPSEVRQLAQGFELGSHTRDHVRLDYFPAGAALEQVRLGKEWLEDTIGQSVTGFCYPRGIKPLSATGMLKDMGIRYARTTEHMRMDLGRDLFSLPTTIQVYPHAAKSFIREVTRRPTISKFSLLTAPHFLSASLWQRLRTLALLAHQREEILHIWGHSWEIEQLQMWDALEEFLAWIAALQPRSMTIQQCLLSENRNN